MNNQNNQSRIFIITDISSFIIFLMPLVKSAVHEYRIREDEIDFFFDWVINQLLTDIYGLNIMHHQRHDIYRLMYLDNFHLLESTFKRSVNSYDLIILKECEVKTLVNGRDLFITQRNNYTNFFN